MPDNHDHRHHHFHHHNGDGTGGEGSTPTCFARGTRISIPLFELMRKQPTDYNEQMEAYLKTPIAHLYGFGLPFKAMRNPIQSGSIKIVG